MSYSSMDYDNDDYDGDDVSVIVQEQPSLPPNMIEISLNLSKKLVYIPFYQFMTEWNPSIPTIQRTLDEDRVQYFFDTLNNYYHEFDEVYDMNVISVAKYNHRYFILDGQHRFEALKQFYINDQFLYQHHKLFSIVIMLYDCHDVKELEGIFKSLNNIFQSGILLVESDRQEVCLHVKQYLMDTFKKYHSNAKTPKFPRVNLEDVALELTNTFPDMMSFEIIQEFIKLNEMYGTDLLCSDDEEKKRKYDIITQFVQGTNAADHCFFYSYLIHSIREQNKDKTTKRRPIPINIRNQVWRNHFGNESMFGTCNVCNQHIHYIDSYECGHIVAEANGGATSIHNLVPLCRPCNRGMGKMNLHQYREIYFNPPT